MVIVPDGINVGLLGGNLHRDLLIAEVLAPWFETSTPRGRQLLRRRSHVFAWPHDSTKSSIFGLLVSGVIRWRS